MLIRGSDRGISPLAASVDRVQASVCHPKDLDASHIERWRGWLDAARPVGSPFLSPTYAKAVGECRDDARVAVVTDGAQIVGYFPFQQMGMRRSTAIGFGMSDHQTIISMPGVEIDAGELIRSCGLSVWRFDHVSDDDATFAEHAFSWTSGAVIDLSNGYDGYIAERSSGRYYKSTMQKLRKLQRERGELSIDYDSADMSALRLLLGWKSQQYRRTGRRDIFIQAWTVELLDRLAQSREPDCSGLISVLRAGDAIAAIHFGIRDASQLSLWFPAYDLESANYSPGAQLFLKLAEESAREGITLLDLGKGDEDYKRHFSSREYRVGEGLVMTPSLGSCVSWLRYRPQRAVNDFVVSRPKLRHAARSALNAVGRVRR